MALGVGILPTAVFAAPENVSTLTTSIVVGTGTTRTGIQASGVGSPGFDVTYTGTARVVNTLTVASGTYAPIAGGVAIARRNTATPNFPTVNGNLTGAWNATVPPVPTPVSGPTGARTVHGSYYNTMESLFTSNNLYTGTENLFINDDTAGGGTNVVSNVERMDFFYGSGLTVTSEQAFAVFERGRNGGGNNGGFKVGLITGWDFILNKPSAYSDTIFTVDANTYGPTNLSAINYDVYRNGPGTGPAVPTVGLDWLNNANLGPQGVGGMLFKTSDFVGATTFYGYSVFGHDVTATTGAQLLDWTNAMYYPTNTPQSADNDMDMVATGAALFHTVPEPSSFLLTAAGLSGLAFLRRRRK